MNITILCIGKLKEQYWAEAVLEYRKRLSKYCSLSIDELKEARLSENASKAEEEAAKAEEGNTILKRIKKEDYVIALEITGKQYDSETLAGHINQLAVSGKSNLVFIIGGSIGLSKDVLSRADEHLSFSALTFPHQMMRVIFLEQIYRVFKIIRNEKYHK